MHVSKSRRAARGLAALAGAINKDCCAAGPKQAAAGRLAGFGGSWRNLPKMASWLVAGTDSWFARCEKGFALRFAFGVAHQAIAPGGILAPGGARGIRATG